MGIFRMKKNYQFWKNIWDSKGNSNSTDLLFLDGYEHLGTDFSSKKIVDEIINHLQIEDGSSILEVACGCGFLSRELNENYKYVGVDYSEPIIQKHKSMFNHEVYVNQSNDLQFDDNSFDYVFCYGLFQYLPDDKYADETIKEMLRVSTKGVFIGDLKNKKTRDTHYVISKSIFNSLGFSILESKYSKDNADRYSVFRSLK